MPMISDFFALEEFLVSSDHPELIRNYEPTQHEIAALTQWATTIGDPIRQNFGPVTITSGLRPPVLNDAVRASGNPSSRTSQHQWGEAADLTVRSPKDNLPLVMAFARDTLPVWQGIIYYAANKMPRCVHFAIEPRGREAVRPKSNRWLAKQDGKQFAVYNFEETRIS